MKSRIKSKIKSKIKGWRGDRPLIEAIESAVRFSSGNLLLAEQVLTLIIVKPGSSARDDQSQSDMARSTRVERAAGASSSDMELGDTMSEEFNASESCPEDTDSAEVSLDWHNLWNEAYKAVKEDPEYRGLLTTLEQYLASGKFAVSDGADDPP